MDLIWNYIIMLIKTVSYILIPIGIIGYFWWNKNKTKQYNFLTLTLSRRTGNLTVTIDKGGYFKEKNGARVFKFLKTTKIPQAPPPPHMTLIYQQKNRIKGRLCFFIENGVDNLQPVKIKINNKEGALTIDPMDEAVDFWAKTRSAEISDMLDTRSFWDKYGTQVVSAILVSAALVGAIVMIKFSKEAAVELMNIASGATKEMVKTAASVTGGTPL